MVHHPATPSSPTTAPAALPAGEALPPALRARLGSVQHQLAARARSQATRVVAAWGDVVVADGLTRLERPVVAEDRLAGDVRVRLRGAASRALLALPDGSELWLDGDSELDLAMWERASDLRAVYLVGGRMQAFVAAQARRFMVFLRGGTMVEALGTGFDLRCGERGVEVAVLHGEVRLSHRLGVATARAGELLVQQDPDEPVALRGGGAALAIDAARRWWSATHEASGHDVSDDAPAAAALAAMRPAAHAPSRRGARIVSLASPIPGGAGRAERYQIAAALFVVVVIVAVGLVRLAPRTAEDFLRDAGHGASPAEAAASRSLAAAEPSLAGERPAVRAAAAPADEPADSSVRLKRLALDYEGWRAVETGGGPDFGRLPTTVASALPTRPAPAVHVLAEQAATTSPSDASALAPGAPQRMPDEVYVKFLHASPRQR